MVKQKLRLIYLAKSIEDLRVPPGNRLEALTSDLKGKWSIRINDQWRICFIWQNGEAFRVSIVDYHR
ncbi:MAG: type II toxin-antitoxin system RelE/ParE family toxin [Hyphomicrobiales bacterium]